MKKLRHDARKNASMTDYTKAIIGAVLKVEIFSIKGSLFYV